MVEGVTGGVVASEQLVEQAVVGARSTPVVGQTQAVAAALLQGDDLTEQGFFAGATPNPASPITLYSSLLGTNPR